MAPTKDSNTPSVGDQKFFATIFKYLPKNIEMNWEDFAQEMGFKNSTIAKARFSQIRRKHEVGSSATGDPVIPTKITKQWRGQSFKKGKLSRNFDAEKASEADGGEDESKSIIKEECLDEEEATTKNENGNEDEERDFHILFSANA
ncbi:hypothetical protein F4677DRAFT_440690 [Hypoxylon crocopeplum]|nr:hypothetical protein F4677DRAFT_440690 [Hypoxylon crocopeplum]